MNNVKPSAKVEAKKNSVDYSKVNVKEKLQPFENLEKKTNKKTSLTGYCLNSGYQLALVA